MARPPNKSGKGPPNGMDFESLQKRAQRTTVQSETDFVRAGELLNKIDAREELIDYGVPGEVEKELLGMNAKSQERLDSINGRSDVRQRSQIERIADLTQIKVAQSYSSSSINGQSMQVSRGSSAINASMTMGNTPWETLERRKASAQNTIENLSARAATVSEGLYNSQGEQDPRKVAELQRLESKRNAAVNVMGTTEAAMRTQRNLGMDPQSRKDDLFKVGGRAANMLGAAQVAEDVNTGNFNINRGGKAVSIAANDFQKAQMTEAKALTDALSKLAKETDETSANFRKLKGDAEEAADNIEKLDKGIAASGGGIRGSQVASALASGFQSASGAAQEILVNQRLQQVSNITGLAGIENQKYDTYKSAAKGNIAAQMQLSQFGAAEGFGNAISTGQITATGLQGLGALAQTGAGVLQMTEGGGEKFNPATYALGTSSGATQELVAGGVNTAAGLAQTATTGMDLYRRTTETSSRISAVNGYLASTQALQHVGAEQLQGFRDFGAGLGATARGMGSAGAGFINRSMELSKGTPNGQGGIDSALSMARMSPEEFNKMSQMGVQNMGSTFNEKQVFAARGLERSGLGTMQENMGRMSTLAAAGANNPQTSLGGVLEAAVSKGMDSSKAINAMVDHTASMAASSVGRAMGLDTSAAAATMLSSMVDPNSKNKEASLERAASLQENIKAMGTNRDMSFSGMVATSRISKTTGMTMTEAISAQSIDTETLRAMKDEKDPSKRAEQFRQKGINVSAKDSGKMVNTLLDDRAATLIEGGGIGFAVGNERMRDSILKKVKDSKGKIDFNKLTEDEQLMLGKTSINGKVGNGVEALKAIEAVYAENDPHSKKKIAGGMAGKGGSEAVRGTDDLLTQGSKQLAQAAAEATKGFKSAQDAFAAVSKMAKSVEKLGDTGYEGKAKGAAAASAESFGAGAAKIDHAGGIFLEAAKIMAAKAGLGAANDPHANREIKKLENNVKSKLGLSR